MDDVILVTFHLRASIKLLLAKRRARADRHHIKAKAYVYNDLVDIIAEKVSDNLRHEPKESN